MNSHICTVGKGEKNEKKRKRKEVHSYIDGII